jgi:crotonobetainyl-CoA:carnitine CoA-transferase CaiB-like acyl-CoA transferase
MNDTDYDNVREHTTVNQPRRPLEGLRVLELGALVAGPFATRLFAEFGAEVIKVEAPGSGDPLRNWRYIDPRTGASLWWSLQSRNKKLITLNLKHPEGLKIAKRLIAKCDILVENFRPGTLEHLGLGWEVLHEVNPRLIVTRISGYGQTGPYTEKPGFGSVGEVMGGLRYVTGFPEQPPVRSGISLGDSLASLYAVIGTLMAIYSRDVRRTGEGQMVDVGLYEAVFSLMESTLPDYDVAGIIRSRTGNALPGIAPTNTYKAADGSYIVIGANSDPIFRRLMQAIGRADIADAPEYSDNAGRAQQADQLDHVIEAWTRTHTPEEILAVLDAAKVPAGPIYSIADIVDDEQYKAREMIREDEVDGIGKVKMPGLVPKLSVTPGGIDWYGGRMGTHNAEVYGRLLSLSPEQIASLSEEGVI